METLHYQNDRIEIEIAPEPFFTLKKFRDRRSGLNLCGSGPQEITADRKLLDEISFLGMEEQNNEILLNYRVGDIRLERHLFFYRTAGAFRYYDVFSTENDHAAMYYSTLLNLVLETEAGQAECVDFFSSTDHSNHRLLRRQARPGKNVGGYFLTDRLFIYKEAPMPDSRPIKGEYDFLWIPGEGRLEMVGLGFDNLRRGEKRRAYGVVVGLRDDFGLQRYQRERYSRLDRMEVLANSWPALHLDVTEPVIMRELELAAESGVSTVFIDDGYFSEFMGEIDTKKFPARFTALAARAAELGVELGLWANPLGLDIRHPKMLLWDGTEERDFMLDPPKWNWLARTNDFQQTELQGGAGAERSYSPVELLEPECFRFMKDKFTGYYREFGIRRFKFDLYQLTAFNTQRGDAQLHYEAYRRLLEELQQEIPGLVISMDITRRNRPGFDFGLDFGRLFLENRDRNYPDHRYYHPYMALGNFHQTAQFVPAHRIELEMMPQAAEYSVNYIAGTTVFATPLYWGLLADTSPQRRAELKTFFEQTAALREQWKNCLVLPIGEVPREGNWSAVLAREPEGARGWLGVYRHGAEQQSCAFDPAGMKVRKKLLGSGEFRPENERTVFSEHDAYAFSLYELADC